MSVTPQPSPLSWAWEKVRGAIQEHPDQPPRPVTLIRLRIQHLAGEFVGHFHPDDIDRLVEGAAKEAREARSGLVTATELPERPNGNVSPLRRP